MKIKNEKKRCTECHLNLDLVEFHKDGTSVQAKCKKCTRIYSQSWYKANKRSYNKKRSIVTKRGRFKTCQRCGRTRERSDFSKSGKYFATTCKACNSIRTLENYRNNRPARLASMRLWNAKIKANRIKLEPQTLEQKLAKSRIKWRDNKDAFVAYKGGECVCCGYSRTSSALEFHHVIPSDKEFSISCSSSLEKVYYELDKCVLLCSNCHREVHSGFINIPRDALVTWANAM